MGEEWNHCFDNCIIATRPTPMAVQQLFRVTYRIPPARPNMSSAPTSPNHASPSNIPRPRASRHAPAGPRNASAARAPQQRCPPLRKQCELRVPRACGRLGGAICRRWADPRALGRLGDWEAIRRRWACDPLAQPYPKRVAASFPWLETRAYGNWKGARSFRT